LDFGFWIIILKRLRSWFIVAESEDVFMNTELDLHKS